MSSVTDYFQGISQKYSEQLFWKKIFWGTYLSEEQPKMT